MKNTIKTNFYSKKRWSEAIALVAFMACFFLIDRSVYYLCLQAYQNIPRAETGGMVPEAIKNKADLVVLGSSIARHHYVPAILEDTLGVSVYNLGSDGQGLGFMRCALDILLGHYQPDFFVFDISPSMLSQQRNNVTMPRVALLSAYLDESNVVREMIYEKSFFEKFKYVSRAFRFNDLPVRYLYNGIFPRKELALLKGFSPILRTFTPKTETTFAGNSTLDPRAIRLLHASIVQAKMRGVPVIIVQSPHWHWRDKPGSSLVELYNKIIEIAESEQVPFIQINPQTYPQFRDHRLYADASHLNNEGAKIFSKILAERLLTDNLVIKKIE